MKNTILIKKVFNSAVSFLISMMSRSLHLFVLLVSLVALSSGQIYAQYSVLQEFIVGSDGSSHLTNEMVTDSTFFYGTVLAGGAMGNGYLFKINIDSTGIQVLFDFDETNIGINNTSISLIIFGSIIYGTADKGGASGSGMIFMIKTDGTGFIKLHDFDNTNGKYPFGKLTAVNSDLIGTTLNGGSNDAGIVFKYSINGNTFQKIFDFDSINGANPTGGLLLSGSSLYGLTSSGGLNGGGVLYKINSDGSGFQNLHDFADSTGSHPLGSLVQIDSCYYGTNSSGGANMMGNVFRINTTGENYEPVVNFDDFNGNSPRANLTVIENRIYGTTYFGGSNDLGVLFSMYKDRPGFQVLYDFNTSSGYYPRTSLNASGSKLIGTTTEGGTTEGGVLFIYETDYPDIQAYNLNFFSIQPGQMSLSWLAGNGSSRIVFIKKDSTGSAYPKDGISYNANSQFGQGSQIDTSGWYCVYKGTDDEDTITGLAPNTLYRAMVIDFNGSAGNEKYLISTSYNNPRNQATRPGVAGFIETFNFKQAYATGFSYSRNIIADGCTPMISHGICWAIHPLPTLADSVHIDGSYPGEYNTLIGYQKPNTTYYARTFLLYPADTIYGDEVLFATMSVESSIISAYDMLIPPLYGWGKDPNNWVFGSIAGGDANKGSEMNDQSPINLIQTYQATPESSYTFENITVISYTLEKWIAMYEGIARCNDAIIAVTDSLPLDPYARKPLLAELRFLRAFYYFELIKVFGPKLPWIDETNMLHDVPVPNNFPIWSQVENDFQNAINSLPDVSDSPGQVNVWAARAFNAKLLLYQKRYAEAKVLFDDVIANGKTTSGDNYALLDHFDDNFNILYNNSSESVFAQQARVDDWGNNMKANPGYSLAYPMGGPGGCCGFLQPSQSLVNSFIVDGSGLPSFDTSHETFPFNLVDLKNDDGILSVDPYTPDIVTPIDPRLDWTVGRRGIPYLDWGIHPGNDWIRDQQYGGPYAPIKNVYREADELAGRTRRIDNWAPGSELNHNLMRFADVLLMAAECEVELGDLAAALSYVNQVRSRAGNSHVQNGGEDAANYQIGTYSSFPDQQFAREAIRFERKLELAMEGHRFFDLVRWGDDYAEKELNSGYLAHESIHRAQFVGALFDTCQKYFTIPQSVTFYLPQAKLLGDSAFRLHVTSPSGLPVSYSVSDTTVVKIIGDTLYLLGLGEATVTAYQSIRPGCLPVSSDEKVITIIDINTQLDATNFSCETGSTGYIDLTVSGGTAPYTYLWSNDSTSEDISGLYEGKYLVSVTDANGCTVMDSTNIVLEGKLIIDLPDSAGFCPGESTILSAPAGLSQYEWSTGETDINRITVTTQDQYRLVVTDSLGCTGRDTIEVIELPAINTQLDATNFSCETGSTGYIDLTITGGTAPYTYLWSNSSTSEDIFGLYEGKYLVSVTDANGCTVMDSTNIVLEGKLIIDLPDSAGFCLGESTILTAPAGLSQYEWSTGETDTYQITVKTQDQYWLVVTDSLGCTGRDTVEVVELPAINTLLDVTNFYCEIVSTGNIDLTVTGGKAPYTYLWSNGSTSEDISGLYPGKYLVSVTDANGCTVTDSVMLSKPDILSSTITDSTNISCYGYSDGSATVTPTGETTPYNYLWDNPASTTNSTVTGLYANQYYHVTITDANGCTVTDSVMLSEPDVLSSTITDSTNISCYGYSDGSATVTPTGGTTPYNYLWDNPAITTDSTVTGLYANQYYHITITDDNGCTITDSMSLSEPSELLINITDSINASSSGSSDGSATITPQGGTPPYTYLWDDNINTIDSTVTGLSANNYYHVTVMDANGCTVYDSLMLGVTYVTKQELNYDLKIYPNPFTNKTVIEFYNSDFDNYQLIVTDISGKIVRIIADIIDNKIELNRSNLSKGFYLIELRGPKIYRGKILIE